METKNKTKKMSNEGHNTKVPYGGTIGLVFLIGLIVGCIVVFLAVAGRTQSVIAERKLLLKEKMAKEASIAPNASDGQNSPGEANSPSSASPSSTSAPGAIDPNAGTLPTPNPAPADPVEPSGSVVQP